MVREGQKSVRRRRRKKRKEERPSILELPIVVKERHERRIDCAATLVELVRPALGEVLQEVMLSVCLDARGFITHVAIVGIGTLTACLTHPREVFRQAIKSNAAAIILMHTHPSGDPEPSEEDYELTIRIREASALIGIPLLDHVILGGARYWSFGAHGQLELCGVGHG